MDRMPYGIVTVRVNGKRYRGGYYFEGDELVVTAYGLGRSSAGLAVLGNDRGKAALNLAKLVLIDMVRDAVEVQKTDPGLCLEGTTTELTY